MREAMKAIPEGFHSVTPTITVPTGKGNEAMDFYKKALGAEELMRMPGPDGKGVMHGEIKIGNSILFIGEEFPRPDSPKSPKTLGGVTNTFYVYVQDSDTAFKKAVDAGGKVTMPIADTFWGDRAGSIIDPFGHMWMIGTRKKDLTPEEMGKAAQEFYAQMASKQ